MDECGKEVGLFLSESASNLCSAFMSTTGTSTGCFECLKKTCPQMSTLNLTRDRVSSTQFVLHVTKQWHFVSLNKVSFSVKQPIYCLFISHLHL